MIDREDKNVLMTTAWLFMQHGQTRKALALCREVNEAEPSDGVCAALLAQLLLEDGDASAALSALEGASCPKNLERVVAFLKTRALNALGRKDEADECWSLYIRSRGKSRKWVSE